MGSRRQCSPPRAPRGLGECWATLCPGFLGVSARSGSSEQRALRSFVGDGWGAAAPIAGDRGRHKDKERGSAALGETLRGPPASSFPSETFAHLAGRREPPRPRGRGVPAFRMAASVCGEDGQAGRCLITAPLPNWGLLSLAPPPTEGSTGPRHVALREAGGQVPPGDTALPLAGTVALCLCPGAPGRP